MSSSNDSNFFINCFIVRTYLSANPFDLWWCEQDVFYNEAPILSKSKHLLTTKWHIISKYQHRYSVNCKSCIHSKVFNYRDCLSSNSQRFSSYPLPPCSILTSSRYRNLLISNTGNGSYYCKGMAGQPVKRTKSIFNVLVRLSLLTTWFQPGCSSAVLSFTADLYYLTNSYSFPVG